MDNSQFRRLLGDSSPKISSTESRTPSASQHDGSTHPLLGSRARASMPMTPRSITSSRSSRADDFARQVFEHKRSSLGEPASKKFKSSAAPKGTRLAAGYQDRASLLRGQDEVAKVDDKAARVQALHEMVKLQQIDQATFDKLRDEIGVGGDVASTHLVRGLDRKLLDRVKKGEDVMAVAHGEKGEKDNKGDGSGQQNEQTHGESESDSNNLREVDEELADVLAQEIQTAKREPRVKRGEHAGTPSLNNGLNDRLSRDEILKQLKSSRAAAARELEERKSLMPTLGNKFHQISQRQQTHKTKFTETVDGRRREVLVVNHPDGTTKRKVRWIDRENTKRHAEAPIAPGEALGMEVPAEIVAKQKVMAEKLRLEEEADDDIFTGVRAEYDPLGVIGGDSEDESGHSSVEIETTSNPKQGENEAKSKPRNYFSTKTKVGEDGEAPASAMEPINDPGILAALKRAATLRQAQDHDNDTRDGNTSQRGDARSQEFLHRLRKREKEDAADMDLGFGENRFGDEDDDASVAVWDGDEEQGGSKDSRKRGRRKRKGDKHNVKDVMAAMDQGRT